MGVSLAMYKSQESVANILHEVDNRYRARTAIVATSPIVYPKPPSLLLNGRILLRSGQEPSFTICFLDVLEGGTIVLAEGLELLG